MANPFVLVALTSSQFRKLKEGMEILSRARNLGDAFHTMSTVSKREYS